MNKNILGGRISVNVPKEFPSTSTLHVSIDGACSSCQEALEAIKKIPTTREGVYINRVLATGMAISTQIHLIPDYNNNGILTHFHIKVIK